MNRLMLMPVLLLMTLMASASQPLRRIFNYTQSDGTVLQVRKCGDARFSWWETADGTKYERNIQSRDLVSMDAAVFAEAQREAQRSSGQRRVLYALQENGMGVYGQSGLGTVPSIGCPRIPVIMVAYSDLDFQPEDTQEKVSRFLNEEGYKDEKLSVGSVADYFRFNSHGLFSPTFDIVAKVTLPNDYRYYGAHSGGSNDAHRYELVQKAVELAVEQGVDFSDYATESRVPIVSILHAGPGEHEDFGADCDDFMWAHFSDTSISAGDETTISSYIMCNESMRSFDAEGNVTGIVMTGIGTYCHEFGHALGLPDDYDVNGSTDGEAETPGFWDIMDYQFMYNGYRPMGYSAYERSMMGWLKVEDLTEGGSYELYPLNAYDTDRGVDLNQPMAYRIVNPENDKEYFILENRKNGPFYAANYLGEGMLIWHIDYDRNRWSANRLNTQADHQLLRVVPADGAWQPPKDLRTKNEAGELYLYPGDLFPGYQHVTVFDNSLDQFFGGEFTNICYGISSEADGTIRFDYGTLTQLTSLFSKPSASPIYDLQGRIVANPIAGRLYVQDEKVTKWGSN